MKRYIRLSLSLLSLVSLNVMAHPNHDQASLVSGLVVGFLHPLLGIDHLLTFIFVGAIGASFSLSFKKISVLMLVASLTLGFVFGHLGWHKLSLSLTEQIISVSIVASVLIVGFQYFTQKLSLLFRGKMNVLILLVCTAYVYFHGVVHGYEIPQGSSALSFFLGFIFAAILLLSLGHHIYKSIFTSQNLQRET